VSRIVAWTGHRPDVFLDPAGAHTAVDNTAREMAESGTEQFLVGGQRGVDTWAALAGMAYAVPFVVILPLPIGDFARGWSALDRAVLEQTIAQAADLRIAAGYRERNRQLATAADLLIAVWTRTHGGGTAETIDFAREAGTPCREIVLEPAPNAHLLSGRGI
jgi:hypothetical protein